MASTNLFFKTRPDKKAIQLLVQRSIIHKTQFEFNGFTNPADFEFKVLRRDGLPPTNPSFMKWPIHKRTFASDYIQAGVIHPWPVIESISMTYGGKYGASFGISGTITCFDKGHFAQISQIFCVPGAQIVDLKFKHSKSTAFDKTSQQVVFPTAIIATYSVTYDSNNRTWTISFDAVGPSHHLKFIDASILKAKQVSPVAIDGTGTNPTPTPRNEPRSILDQIYLDAMLPGNTSKDASLSMTSVITDAKQRLTAITKDRLLTPSIAPGNPKHIDPYSAKTYIHHVNNSAVLVVQNELFASIDSANSDTAYTKDVNKIYVTLAYLVERIFNQKVIPAAADKAGNNTWVDKLRINLDPDLSRGNLPMGHIGSGDPRRIIINGMARTLTGNYKDLQRLGVDFNTPILFGFGRAPKTCSPNPTAGNVNLAAIYVSVDVVKNALEVAGYTPQDPSMQESLLFKAKQTAVDVHTFFSYVFEEINRCTGGALSLELVDRPVRDKDPAMPHEVHTVIVDQNYAKPLPGRECIVFNPVDGDGSTISCRLVGSQGSNTYQAAMMAAAMKSGDLFADIERIERLKVEQSRAQERVSATLRILQLIQGTAGTSVAASKFSTDVCNKLCSELSQLVNNLSIKAEPTRNLMYPGLGLELELDGVFGIFKGNAISATAAPPQFVPSAIPNTDNGGNTRYFTVSKVEHTLTHDRWVTKLSAYISIDTTPVTPITL